MDAMGLAAAPDDARSPDQLAIADLAGRLLQRPDWRLVRELLVQVYDAGLAAGLGRPPIGDDSDRVVALIRDVEIRHDAWLQAIAAEERQHQPIGVFGLEGVPVPEWLKVLQ